MRVGNLLAAAALLGALSQYNVDDGRRWFAAGTDASSTSDLERGARAEAFNDTAVAEKVLWKIIHSQPQADAASRAHELLSRIYLRSGQYAHAIQNLDEWAASFPRREEVRRERKDIEQLRGLPNQVNGSRRRSALRHDPGDDFSVPLSINGQPATYLFDTGAWISVIVDSEAKRLGMAIRAGSGRIGDSSGNGVGIRTAVARQVTIGSMRFENVSFAVVPNDGPWASVPAGQGGIVGVPLIMALGRARWSAEGSWEVGGRSDPADSRAANLTFSGNHLLISATVSGAPVFGVVDTGASTTDLNGNFAEQFADLVQRTGTREKHDITGLGGTASIDGVSLPEVLFDVHGTRAPLRPAHVTFQRTPGTGGVCCIGNIGLDLLTQTGHLTLDFSSMTLDLQ